MSVPTSRNFTLVQFQDQTGAIMLITVSLGTKSLLGLSLLNFMDWYFYCRTNRQHLQLLLVVSILLNLFWSSIKTVDFFTLYAKHNTISFNIMDSLKSITGQLINPIAMFVMYLRAKILFYEYKHLMTVLRVLAYVVLLGGLGIAIGREWMAWQFRGTEDDVFGKLRVHLGIYLIIVSTSLQILLTFTFFVHLYWTMIGNSAMQKEKEDVLQGAGIQMVLIAFMTFFYFWFRPQFLRWPPNVLGTRN
jgi:hypothetical protein